MSSCKLPVCSLHLFGAPSPLRPFPPLPPESFAPFDWWTYLPRLWLAATGLQKKNLLTEMTLCLLHDNTCGSREPFLICHGLHPMLISLIRSLPSSSFAVFWCQTFQPHWFCWNEIIWNVSLKSSKWRTTPRPLSRPQSWRQARAAQSNWSLRFCYVRAFQKAGRARTAKLIFCSMRFSFQTRQWIHFKSDESDRVWDWRDNNI